MYTLIVISSAVCQMS